VRDEGEGGAPAEVGDVGAEDVAGGHRADGRDAGGTDPKGEPADDADRQPEAQVVAQDVEPAEVGAAGGDLLDLMPDRPGDEQREEDDDASRHAQRRLALPEGRSRRRRHGHPLVRPAGPTASGSSAGPSAVTVPRSTTTRRRATPRMSPTVWATTTT